MTEIAIPGSWLVIKLLALKSIEVIAMATQNVMIDAVDAPGGPETGCWPSRFSSFSCRCQRRPALEKLLLLVICEHGPLFRPKAVQAKKSVQHLLNTSSRQKSCCQEEALSRLTICPFPFCAGALVGGRRARNYPSNKEGWHTGRR